MLGILLELFLPNDFTKKRFCVPFVKKWKSFRQGDTLSNNVFNFVMKFVLERHYNL